MDNQLTCQELVDMIVRNFSALRTTWNAAEKEESRTCVRIAAEMLAEQVKEY